MHSEKHGSVISTLDRVRVCVHTTHVRVTATICVEKTIDYVCAGVTFVMTAGECISDSNNMCVTVLWAVCIDGLTLFQ